MKSGFIGNIIKILLIIIVFEQRETFSLKSHGKNIFLKIRNFLQANCDNGSDVFKIYIIKIIQ